MAFVPQYHRCGRYDLDLELRWLNISPIPRGCLEIDLVVELIMIHGRLFHMIDMVAAENMIRLEWCNCLNTSNNIQVIKGHLKGDLAPV